MVYDVIIAEGGAAGLFCAANTKLKGKGLIIEGSKHPGLKLVMAGSGQCNFTHGGDIRDFADRYGKNGRKIRGILYKFNNVSTCEFFEEHGVKTVERDDGKVFPASFDGKEIRALLLDLARENGFEIRTEEKVTNIAVCREGYRIATASMTYRCRRLVIATGGKSYPQTGSDGSMFKILESLDSPPLVINELRPALVPIYTADYMYGNLAGISVEAEIKTDKKTKMRGRLLFTHRNFSGPLILDFSRYLKEGMGFELDYVPNGFKCGEHISTDGQNRSMGNFLADICDIPKAFADILVDKAIGEKGACGKKASSFAGGEIKKIETLVRGDKFTVSGTAGFGKAMATAGGVDISEVATRSMEAKKYPGLYFIGEVLDIDGDTGGYNIQFAFSTGRTAARHISQLP